MNEQAKAEFTAWMQRYFSGILNDSQRDVFADKAAEIFLGTLIGPASRDSDTSGEGKRDAKDELDAMLRKSLTELSANHRQIIVEAAIYICEKNSAASPLQAIRQKIEEWRAELAEIERRIPSAYASEANAAAARRLEMCIDELSQLAQADGQRGTE